MNEKSVRICNWCCQVAVLVWVHGHYQCSVCRINVDECCRGEKPDDNIIVPAKKNEEDSESQRN